MSPIEYLSAKARMAMQPWRHPLERRSQIIRQIGIVAVWLLLMWVGLNAIGEDAAGEGDLLLLYVFVASTALAGIIAKVWAVDDESTDS
jgi:hypothetical protein